MKTDVLKVSGMSCGHCVKAVEESVGGLAGVKTVAVDLNGGKVEVSYDESAVTLDAIKETIDDQGYEVE
ncbi:copper resistance protein CopZ [Bacillus sp. FJAT-27916]|uniref:copper chaperone CopZ n=1 Tax=Bacillaceae TaxID=186817 RepID=UPI0006709603|nr:copper chaperone CopZ [Bacillus sp. FJAT-27916]KMY46008.1 copper resistance protein CopZ [Bacillus sp. FJAT-27916]